MGRKQIEIEGTERPHDDEISAAIEDLKDARTKRTAAKAEADAATARLVELMLAKGIDEYIDPELEAKVTVSEKTRLSLREFKVRDDARGEAAE